MLRTIKQNSAPLSFGAAASILLAALFIERIASNRTVSRMSRRVWQRRRTTRTAPDYWDDLAVQGEHLPKPALSEAPRLDAMSQIDCIVARMRQTTERISIAGTNHRSALRQLNCLEFDLENLREELALVIPDLAPAVVDYGSNRKKQSYAKNMTIAA